VWVIYIWFLLYEPAVPIGKALGNGFTEFLGPPYAIIETISRDRVTLLKATSVNKPLGSLFFYVKKVPKKGARRNYIGDFVIGIGPEKKPPKRYPFFPLPFY
jgi:hypothetical protein